MKLPAGLFLLCLALTVSVRAEEAVPVKKEVPEVKRELVWPEIKDPQALIEFAKAEIKRIGDSDRKWGWPMTIGPEFAYLHAGNYYVRPDYLFVELDTQPATGQGLLVLPNPNSLNEKLKDSAVRIEETTTPGIKRILGSMRNFSDYSWSIYRAYESAAVRWRNIRNLSRDKNSWPIPLELRLPAYPVDVARQGVQGEANVEFIVSESGAVSAITIKATHEVFESAVRQVSQLWRFEPGVDLETRLPAVTRMSLTVKFIIDRG